MCYWNVSVRCWSKKIKKKPYIVGENQRYDCLTKEPTHNNNLKIDITPPQKSTHNVNILFPYLRRKVIAFAVGY